MEPGRMFTLVTNPSHGAVEELGQPQADERFGPDAHRPLHALLHEDDLPVVVAYGQDVAVVAIYMKSFRGLSFSSPVR
jgi:hypothetical protein